MGSLALLLYEYSITLDYEVELIWEKPNKSFIKWLFLFIHYFALVSQVSTQIVTYRVRGLLLGHSIYGGLWLANPCTLPWN